MTDTPSSPGCLTIDLGMLASNWRAANDASGHATASAVVKADGYGLGVKPVVEALYGAGCRSFFVALPNEGLAIRAIAPDADIFVLNGTMSGPVARLADAGLVPVLNDLSQVAAWVDQSKGVGEPLPAAIMIDTGMNRLGLHDHEVAAFAADSSLLDHLRIKLVMSHLACADDPASQMNKLQRQRFDAARTKLPDAPASLANSGGIFLGPDYHYDLTRPGICLYGATPFKDAPAPFGPVVSATAEIIQVRDVKAGETIGYGATFTAASDLRTATIAAGYADGLFRTAGNSAVAALHGTRLAYLGRVSMDLVVLDVSSLDPSAVRAGDMVELIGPHVSVDDLAQATGTIGYEVLTSLGTRYERRYISG